jgi:hypothetical protein
MDGAQGVIWSGRVRGKATAGPSTPFPFDFAQGPVAQDDSSYRCCAGLKQKALLMLRIPTGFVMGFTRRYLLWQFQGSHGASL